MAQKIIVFSTFNVKLKKIFERREIVKIFLSENLKKLRIANGLSQQDLAEKIFVNRSTVARWENETRLPDAFMLTRLAKLFDTDINTLMFSNFECNAPNVIIVDDRKFFLSETIPILEEVLPNANIFGFTRPSEAIEYAKINRIALAFLDIELGKMNGLELCKNFLEINPQTNVIFLTNYVEYSFDAWKTGAIGFTLKPITAENVRELLKNLRYPLALGENFDGL